MLKTTDNTPYEKIGDEVRSLADEVPFDIPDSWEWVRLGTLLGIISDGTHKTPNYVEDGVPFLSVQNISKGYFDFTKVKYITEDEHRKLCERVAPQAGDILFCRIGTLGKAIKCTLNIEFSIFVSLGLLRPIDPSVTDYLVFTINSPLGEKWIQENKVGGGTHTYKINLSDIPNMLIPLPPYQEQNRIFAKLQELKPILHEYGKTEERLDSLSEGFPEALKKSILQEAVQGKLVPQDPSDEPAEALLERIRAEKQRLIKEGKIKKGKQESVIFRRDNSHYEKLDGAERCIDDELPFEIPDSWVWVRLIDICEYIQRGKSPKYSPIKKYPVIAQKCNQWSGFSIEKAQFIEPESITSYGRERFLQNNDLMWNSTGLGTLGRMAVYKSASNPYGLAVADSHVTVIRPLKEFISPQYLYYYFSNPTVQSVIEDQADGTTKQKELSATTVRTYLVPLPPYNEQIRIVKQIETVLPLVVSV